MITFSFRRSISLAYAGLLVTCAFLSASRADDSEGVVRLGGTEEEGVVQVRSESEEVVRGQNNRRQMRRAQNCPPQDCPPQQQYCPDYSQGFSWHDCPGKDAFDSWLVGQCMTHRCRQQMASAHVRDSLREDCHEKCAWARCKFGYFIPTGACGKGAPPFGHYSMVYPVNPAHFDARDGQVYAAQGYGGPISVPMAPVVNHTYNYGWGIPSSRLTPISHPVSPAQAEAARANGANAYDPPFAKH